MQGYQEFKEYLGMDDAFKAFQILCEMIEYDNPDSVKCDVEWGKYIHSQTLKDYRHILCLIEGYFNTKYRPEEMTVMYAKFDRLYTDSLET